MLIITIYNFLIYYIIMKINEKFIDDIFNYKIKLKNKADKIKTTEIINKRSDIVLNINNKP